MSDIGERYRRHAANIQDVLPAGADFTAPSPCAGWSAADVVDHMIDTQRAFLSGQGLSGQGLTGRDVELGARPAGDPPAAWAAHTADVLDRVDDELLRREYDGFFGRTTLGATLADFYGFDMIAHRWDIARALGGDTRFTDAEMDDMEASIALFGEHLYGEGICRSAVPVPADADRQDRLLGKLGRDPRS